MILKEIFGDTSRIKILEEMLIYKDEYLTAEEISRMAEVSNKTVYLHMEKLNSIGLIDIEKKGSKKFKLKDNDERVLALELIESNEYLRQSQNHHINLRVVNVKENVNLVYRTTNPSTDINWNEELIKAKKYEKTIQYEIK